MPSERHKARPHLAPRHPVHVVARLAKLTRGSRLAKLTRGSRLAKLDGSVGRTSSPPARTRLPALASQPDVTRALIYRALRRALALSLARSDFRIVHLAVLRNRIELLVEADNKTALARGMQGFQVSAAKWLNRSARRRGTVFPDRYRMRILKTRVDVRDLVGRLPPARTEAWPQTWLLRIELVGATRVHRTGHGAGHGASRRWLRSRADEDS